MELSAIKTYLLSLPTQERLSFLSEIEDSIDQDLILCKGSRRELLNNKQGCCPHCGHLKYVKFGFKSGSQRYKCKSCDRSFTEYTGTWMSGIHKKDKIDSYMVLMSEEKSLDKIKSTLLINKKTAFDWRHKILASLSDVDKDDFTGITESDETFFLDSNKGSKVVNRKARKRGGSATKRGTNQDHVAVIVTMDRDKSLDLTVVTKGRIKKKDIEKAIGGRCNEQTILCSDGHMSYKGFAIDNKLEHHLLRVDLKKRVKDKIYHIQHVNATHMRVKKWIDEKFWGVSTKYLQQYLNWYRIRESIKDQKNKIQALADKSIVDINAYQKYREINQRYQLIISTQI